MPQRSPTSDNKSRLLAEIANEAESNDGIKSVSVRAKTFLVVRYQNGFHNEWLATHPNIGVDPLEIAAQLRSQFRSH